MTSTHEMTTRGGHYGSLVETMEARGATKLHPVEREQLLAAADALLFDEPESEAALTGALELIVRLQDSERWTPESATRLREHLLGCGPGTTGSA